MTNAKTPKSTIRGLLIILVVFSFVVNVLLLAMPLYMLQIYDRILPSRSLDTLLYLSIIVAGALIVLGLMEAVRPVLASRAAAKLELELGSDAMRLSLGDGQSRDGDINAVRDLSAIRNFISSRALFSLMDIPFAPLFIGILYLIHPNLFYLTAAGAVVLFGIAIFNQWLINKPSDELGHRQRLAFGTAQAISRSSESLKAMGLQANGIRTWGNQNAEALITQGSVDVRNAVLTGLSRTIRMGLQVAILGVGALLVLNNEMTPGMIFAASIISSRGLQPIDQVIGGWKQIAMVRRSWSTLTENLKKLPPEVKRTELPEPKGQISVTNILALAPGGLAQPPILNRVTFNVEPGEVIGIVGPSGSGKSTLARILVGAQQASSGEIRFDGTELKNWAPDQIGPHIGYLGQDIELLPGTVKNNIARLSENPDDQAVMLAASKAQVHELIQSLPQAYDTMIGSRDAVLSGGQRQRIALARAFYGSPRIMILDEPNANLDDDGELALRKAMMQARADGVTVIVITQRKTLLNDVDKILRLHKGTVDFFGTPKELIAKLNEAKANSQGTTNPPPTQTKKTPTPLAAPIKSPPPEKRKSIAKPTNGASPPAQVSPEKRSSGLPFPKQPVERPLTPVQRKRLRREREAAETLKKQQQDGNDE